MTKKKIIIIIVSILIFVSIIVGTILILNANNGNNNTAKEKTPEQIAQIRTDANSLKSLAIQSIQDGDYSKAMTLLQSAKDNLTEIDDQESLVDVGSLIFQTEINLNPPAIVEDTLPSF